MRHFLKIWSEHFGPIHDGVKKAELRKDDRSPPFEPQDELILQEWDTDRGWFTGREVIFRVTHAARGGNIPKGYALLSGERGKCTCCDGMGGVYLPPPL